jgi:NADH-quinone oxidoreductase subunit C
MAEAGASPSSSKTERIGELLAEFGPETLAPAADGITGIRLARDVLVEAIAHLKSHAQLSYEMLVSVTAVDWQDRDPRFDVVYHLWSLRHNRLLRVKCGVPDEDKVCPTLVDQYSTANWQEREVYDMFGIRFQGHPDLRRILMPEDYPFHPLLKDFPVEGIDNSVVYRKQGGVLMTRELDVDRPPGQDRTPVDLSKGDPEGFTDGAELAEDS